MVMTGDGANDIVFTHIDMGIELADSTSTMCF